MHKTAAIANFGTTSIQCYDC